MAKPHSLNTLRRDLKRVNIDTKPKHAVSRVRLNLDGLTPKQARFVVEYLKDMNATQAAIRSGYSKRTARRSGNENVQKRAVVAAIQSELQKRATNAGIDAKWVLDAAVELHKRCMEKGVRFAPGPATRALELIGKHINVAAFVRDEQHLHIHLNGLQERLGAARLRVVGKPIELGKSEVRQLASGEDRDE